MVGINSSTPTANLVVEGSSTAPTIPLLTVASSSGTSYLTVLPNGNVLIAWSDVVQEVTRDKQVVFEWKLSPENREIGTAQRLYNGNTLITELGPQPRLLEIAPQGTLVLTVPLQPETDNAHMQTRMARKLSNGNYLVPHLLAFAVKEYTPEGKVVRTFRTDLEDLGGRKAENWPFTAIRLPNGNTLINCTYGNLSLEVDPSGKVVWEHRVDLHGQPATDGHAGMRMGPTDADCTRMCVLAHGADYVLVAADAVYVLSCAVDDAERDLAALGARPSARELREILDWVLANAKPLVGIRLRPE